MTRFGGLPPATVHCEHHAGPVNCRAVTAGLASAWGWQHPNMSFNPKHAWRTPVRPGEEARGTYGRRWLVCKQGKGILFHNDVCPSALFWQKFFELFFWPSTWPPWLLGWKPCQFRGRFLRLHGTSSWVPHLDSWHSASGKVLTRTTGSAASRILPSRTKASNFQFKSTKMEVPRNEPRSYSPEDQHSF